MRSSQLDIARRCVQVGVNKTKHTVPQTIVLGFYAGMFIALAGVASTMVTCTVTAGSLAKLLGALVFPVGIAMVLIAGGELFTGNNLLIVAVLERKLTTKEMLKNWLWVYIGNFLGAAFVAFLVVYSNLPNLFDGQLAQAMVNAAASRTNLTVMEGFARGVLCNILVCIAVWMSYASTEATGKIMTSFGPIMAFVLCGFEHCVANMYFGVAGLLTASSYGIQADSLTWFNYLVESLLPISLGNIVGGACIVGAGYWYVYLRATPHSFDSLQYDGNELS